MENAEEVFQILERFSKLKQKDIPKELDDYLCFVAKTGDTVYRWPMIKHLFREKLMQVIKDFYESTPSIADLPQDPNVDPFNYESMKNALLERLELFNAAPFTVQRICELLTDPRKQYSRIDKFMRAIEKNILVVSTIEPGRKRGESETAESIDSVINGDLSSESVDSDENDITFADLTAKLTNDNKVEGNATIEAKENGNADKPDVEMKDAAEPAADTQSPLPPTEDKKDEPSAVEKLENNEKEESKILANETKDAETAPVIDNKDKPCDMEEDKPVVENAKSEITPADEAMPIEENKTDVPSMNNVPTITVTESAPEANGVVEANKITENGENDVELKLAEEIVDATPKSPSKPVSEPVVESAPTIKAEQPKIKEDEKREPEDLLDEPEPKKLRIEPNYATIQPETTDTIGGSVVNERENEETKMDSINETEVVKKDEATSEVTKEDKPILAAVAVTPEEPLKEDNVIVADVAEKSVSDVVDAASGKETPKEEVEATAHKENGEIKPECIKEITSTSPSVEKAKEESAKETAADEPVEEKLTEKAEEINVETKPSAEEKSTLEPAVEVLDAAAPASVLEEAAIVPAVEEPVAVKTVEEPVVTEKDVVAAVITPVTETPVVVPPVVEESVVVPQPVVPIVDDPVLPAVVAAAAEEEKPTSTLSAATDTPVAPSNSIPAEPIIEETPPISIIDTPVPVEDAVNIPAPLSPMQSSETTQEMDTNSNENKMDADDLVDGNTPIAAVTIINKAAVAADDNAMEVDESVEPMDQ